MSFLSAGWAVAALLAVPVVLLYLLKMRRHPREVSSTMLWQQVLADMRANTPFQKLRRHLLLVLQLLTLGLLIFALCQPMIRASGLGGAETVVVVDASASMQTDDAPQNRTRFEHAIRQAEQLVDSLRPGDRMMLIVAGPPGLGARSAFTSDKGALRRLLRDARAYDAPAGVEDALRLAASSLSALGAGELRGRVYLISDGVGVTIPDSPGLAESLEYVRVGATDANVGIVALAVEPGSEGRQRVLVGVHNAAAAAAAEVKVSFYFGTESHWIDTHTLPVPPRGQATTVLEAPLPPGRLWVKLDGPADALPADSTGYVLLSEPRRLRVRLLSAGNPVMEALLAAARDNDLCQDALPGEPADVTIMDGLDSPDAPPAGDVVWIDPPAQAGPFRRTGTLSRPPLTNIRTEADVLRFVNLSDLAVATAGQYDHDGSAIELASSGTWPLLAYADRGRSRTYLIAFHLADSTWATDVGLPIFLGNVLERARAAHFVGQAQMLPTGQPARLAGDTGPVEVTDPDATRHRLAEGADTFAATTRAGFYTVQTPDGATDFAANLLSPAESDIAPRHLATSAGQAVAERADVTRTDRALWPFVALLAGLVLMVEWYCYHRRAT